jgi:hypothetical protein
MRKVLLFILIVVGFGLNAQKADQKIYKHSIKFAPFRMAASTLAIGYEYQYSNSNSISLLSQIIYSEEQADYKKGYVQDLSFKMSTDKEIDIIGIYPTLFFAPYLQYGFFDFRDAYYDSNYLGEPLLKINDEAKFSMYGGGILIGAGLDFGKKFYLQAYFGGGIKYNNLDNKKHYSFGLNSLWLQKGIYPKGGFEFGFRF